MDWVVWVNFVITAIITALVGFGFIIALILFFVSYKTNRDTQKKQRAVWQKFAAENRLNFMDTDWPHVYVIYGQYQGYNLKLDIFNLENTHKDKGTHTRLALANPNPIQQNFIFTPQALQNTTLEVETALALLKQANLAYNARVYAQENGQHIRYERRYFEANQAYLEFLIKWLSEVMTAYPDMMMLGGELMPELEVIVEHSLKLHSLVLQLIHDISRESSARLSHKASQLLCPACLTRCTKQMITLNFVQTIPYYGCRTCGQSRKFLEGPIFVAVLDNQDPAEMVQQPHMVRINWSLQRHTFDFNAIEIINASDEEVERFAVQAGNDTDLWRQPRYTKIPCQIAADCELSANTIKILHRTFGEIRIKS